MHPAAGELPDEPGFHGTEQQLSGFGLFPGAGHVFQNPADLGTGKVRVDDKAGLGAERLGQTLGAQAVAIFRRAAVLPHDGVVDGLARFLVPHNGGLALVGDADGRNILSSGIHLGQSLGRHCILGQPDFHGVVFHPAGLRKILGKLLLGHAARLTLFIEQDATVRSGAGVQRHNILGHEKTSFRYLGRVRAFMPRRKRQPRNIMLPFHAIA